MLKVLATLAIIALPTLAVTALPTPATAQRIRFESFRIPVVKISDTTFEVIATDSAGPAQIWCAAAQFSDARFGRKHKSLWVAKGYSPSQSFARFKGIVFSTEPVGNSTRSFSFGIRTVGLQKSVGAARFLCDDPNFNVRITDRP